MLVGIQTVLPSCSSKSPVNTNPRLNGKAHSSMTDSPELPESLNSTQTGFDKVLSNPHVCPFYVGRKVNLQGLAKFSDVFRVYAMHVLYP